MGRRRINIDFGISTYRWLTDTAARLGVTRTELVRQFVLLASIHGFNEYYVKEGIKDDRQLANQARAQSQIARRHPQSQ